jgi:hypothetical protein
MNTSPSEFTGILDHFDSDLWGYHITVPLPIAQPFLDDGQRRVVCRLNDTLEFQGALMPKGNGDYFININKARREKLKLKLGSSVQVSLRPDQSEYGLPMPEELAELLRQDDAGDALFHALTPGKQRSLLYIIGSPKTADTRLRRALAVIEHLKLHGGKLDFKRLNEEMKAGR